jgi:hypothetical protein
VAYLGCPPVRLLDQFARAVHLAHANSATAE